MQALELVMTVSTEDRNKIANILAHVAERHPGALVATTDRNMDLCCVHATIGLRLDEMTEYAEHPERYEMADFNLLHDIGGIANHLDRETGELTGFFLPRFAARGE